jgi:DNA-binding XRE family transcriptional regulator
MPRQNKLRHPIKLVREATGLSQRRFAALVGHSKDTIQAIEIGRHNPSRVLAEKIFVQTGAVPETLLNLRGSPLDIEGEAYTRDSFARWTSTINKPTTRLLQREKGAIRYLNWLVSTLQYAALRAGKLFAIQYQLNRCIAELVSEFGLQNNIRGLLGERPYTRFHWLPMFDWKPGARSRLIRRHVVRDKEGLMFGEQEIFGFSRAERERQAAVIARKKLLSTSTPTDRLASGRTGAALRLTSERRGGPQRHRKRKRKRVSS